jgi:hypothetical protein
MNIPAFTDIVQQAEGAYQTPEIRVWCHPHLVGESGDDYYQTFHSFEGALEFIRLHKEAEEVPLIAFRGYELNIFAIDSKG